MWTDLKEPNDSQVAILPVEWKLLDTEDVDIQGQHSEEPDL